MQTRLNVEEREKIFYYLTLNKSYREIGSLLDRSHTTISREIKRNNKESEYSPSRAEELSKPVIKVKDGNPRIANVVHGQAYLWAYGANKFKY